MRQLSQRTQRSLLLLSISLYFGGDVDLAGISKELFCNRRSFKLEMKINRYSNNSKGVSSHCLSEKVSLTKLIGDLWRDLQDKPHWKYGELSPVQLLEKMNLHRNSTDIDELARAEWFWSRRPRLFSAANYIVWLVVVLGLQFWLFGFPLIGVPFLVIAAVVGNAGIVRSVRWRRQYESSICRLIRTSKNDRDIFGRRRC
jgi:hypothetical protein